MAPEANPFPGGVVAEIISKLRENIDALGGPESTFRIETEGCEDGFIKLIGLTSLEKGEVTRALNCTEVSQVIDVANALADLEAGA